MTKVFLTGATGHLGANLAVRLARQGHELMLLMRPASHHPFLENISFQKRVGDIEDRDPLREAMKGCDIGFHLAGYVSYSRFDREKLNNVNVTGTKNVMDAAVENGLKKMIVTSSTAAIGIPPHGGGVLDETGVFEERYKKIGYMWTKKQAEEIALSYRDRLHVVALNPSTFFGAGDTKMNTGALIQKIYRQRIPFAPRGSNAVSAVDDIVEGHMLALEKGRNGERYILASENISLHELITIIAEELGVKKVDRVMPRAMLPIAFIAAWVSENVFKNRELTPQVVAFSSRDRCFSSAKAKKELGWNPRIPIRQAIREAIEFYRCHELLDM